MKQCLFISLLLLACLPLHTFAAAGTEGKEFWIALTIGRGPKDVGTSFEPFICVSSKTRKGTVTVTNPQTNFVRTYQIPTGTGWLEIKDIPTTAWYPYSANEKGQQKASGQTFATGLVLTCDEDVSVFAAIRYENAFDAGNILPITALQSEYIIQDYPPYANESPTTSFSNFCILATENNTEVEITPHARTYDGKAANTTFKVTLKAGDVYYVVSEEANESNSKEKSLSGSYVKALNGKKVAVFNGDICTRTPNHVAARDINYEQAMPIDYWGTEFIVTRSLEKDANRIRITAQEDDTQIYIDNYLFTTLNARETSEIELAVATDMQKYSDNPAEKQLITDVAYIRTSCPCAVYNYDTGNGYKSKSSSQLHSGYGDPSMTWISPLEQDLSEITFGVMNTDKTTRHFVNIITETSNIANIQLREVQAGNFSNNMLSTSDFQPVPANTKYSYARKPLTINKSTTYNLVCSTGGFIAHVYGNGEDESYAYSVGSAAVKRGVQLGNIIYTDGMTSDITYCVGESIEFDAQVGSDIIDKASWDMGDGVTFNDGRTAFAYSYESPGWYDIRTTIYAHKECPATTYPPEDIHYAIRVVIPDTIQRNFFICEGETFEYVGQQYTKPVTDTIKFDCDSIVIFNLEVGQKTTSSLDTIAQDSCLWHNKWYYQSGTYEWVGTNAGGCDSTVTMNLRIITCLELIVHSPEEIICGDQPTFAIPYTYVKGDIGDSWIISNGQQIPLTLADGYFIADMQYFKPNHYEVIVATEDTICEQIQESSITFDIRYPSSLIAQKWNNVLAVYNNHYNGDYTFTAFQWYKNETPIEGAIGSYYHSKEPFSTTDSYAVLLTREDGTTLFTCALQTVQENNTPTVNVAPTVVGSGENITITTSVPGKAMLYNTLGILESVQQVEQTVSYAMPNRPGVYVLGITLQAGSQQTFQLIVK